MGELTMENEIELLKAAIESLMQLRIKQGQGHVITEHDLYYEQNKLYHIIDVIEKNRTRSTVLFDSLNKFNKGEISIKEYKAIQLKNLKDPS